MLLSLMMNLGMYGPRGAGGIDAKHRKRTQAIKPTGLIERKPFERAPSKQKEKQTAAPSEKQRHVEILTPKIQRVSLAEIERIFEKNNIKGIDNAPLTEEDYALFLIMVAAEL